METLPSRKFKAAYSCGQENRKTCKKIAKKNMSFHALEAGHWILKTVAESFLIDWIHALIFSVNIYIVQHLQ